MEKLRKFLLIVSVGVAYSIALSTFLPFTMDEFLVHIPISCALHPLNQLHRAREHCGFYDLAPLPAVLGDAKVYLPLRAYSYVGTLNALLYLPLFVAWPSPYSARALGILMIGIQSIVLSKLFGQNWRTIFFLLVCFAPYAIQHSVDTGQLAGFTTGITLLLWLTRRWVVAWKEPGSRGYALAIAQGLLLFSFIWARINNLIFLPSILSMQIMASYLSVRRYGVDLRLSWFRIFLQIILYCSVFGLLTYVREGPILLRPRISLPSSGRRIPFPSSPPMTISRLTFSVIF
jgi:hypothetical protein